METRQQDAMKLQGGRLSLHHDKCLSASSSMGTDLHPLDISAFALFVSHPPDPIPVPYILTLPSNLSFGRISMFLQYIIFEFDYKSELVDCML